MKKRVGIIGGGASGLVAAIGAAPKRGGSDCHRTYGPRGKKDPFYRQRQV